MYLLVVISLLQMNRLNSGGRNVGPLPTLYGYDGNYIEPVNQWLIHLKAEKRLENLSSYARALKFYWCFLESEELAWDNFPAVKALKPAYRYRNDGLLKRSKLEKSLFPRLIPIYVILYSSISGQRMSTTFR